MNNSSLVSSFAGLIIGLGTLFCPSVTVAAAPAAMDECSRELLLSYFPETFVNDTLKKYNIPQDKWSGINASLSGKEKDIVKMVEQKASSITPNPLKDPQQRQAAVKLFRETLLQVFTDALKENGLQDTSQFQAMLDDIQQQKAKKFAQCMEQQKAKFQQQRPQGETSKDSIYKDNEEESDDNDDDYDDDDNDATETKEKSEDMSKSNSSIK